MAQIFLSIGSNIEREKNIKSCLLRLQTDHPDTIFSTIYETEAFGFSGDPFFNLVASMHTQFSPQEVDSYLKSIEKDHSRSRKSKKFSSRTLDIDLLLYDQLILHPQLDVPRDEIIRYDFVLFPLAEIAADVIHPVYHKTIAELVQDSALTGDNMKAITL